MDKASKLLQTAGFMTAATLLSKLAGMYRDILLAACYGTGTAEAIAFSTASRIPILLFDITLGSAIASTFIPVFNGYLTRGGKKEAFEFSSNFINLVLLITSVCALAGAVFSGAFVDLIAPGISSEAKALSERLLKILFPMIIFTGVAFSFVGVLQSFGSFNIPASISLISNLAVCIYLLFLNKYFGVYGLAVAMLLAWSLQALVQVPELKRLGFCYRSVLNIRHEGIKEVCRLAVPVLISSWVQPINAMVNIRLASYLDDGAAVPALDFANKLYLILAGVFTYTVTNLAFPSLSRFWAADDKEAFLSVVTRALRIVILIISPIMAGFVVLKIPVIKLVYEHGAFDEKSTALTSSALLFYSLGMLGFAVGEVINRCFYALHDGKTPMKISALCMTLNIALSVLFVRVLRTGVGGLALAASISANISALALLFAAAKRVGPVVNGELIFYLLKVLAVSAAMGTAVHFIYASLSGLGLIVSTAASVAAGIVLFFALCLALKVGEVREILDMAGKIGRGR